MMPAMRPCHCQPPGSRGPMNPAQLGASTRLACVTGLPPATGRDGRFLESISRETLSAAGQ